jgi:hypothetical protein
VYKGSCERTGVACAPELLVDACNFGYARGRCTAFPADAAADAVRFTKYNGEVLYILERECAPVEHGPVGRLAGRGALERQAAVFLSSAIA